MLNIEQLRALNGGRSSIGDFACPNCGPDCKSTVNQGRRVLRIWDDGDFVTYKCARCEISGWAKDGSAQGHQNKPQLSSNPEPNKAELAKYLWSRSVSLKGSLAETYLISRGCFIEASSLRFLLPNGNHPPAMIARFGDGEVTSVHLTKLNADGTGKAGSNNDKIIIGPSIGQPIILSDNREREELVVAEGIEDAATLANVTGWSAWAAGSAGRIAPVVAAAQSFPKVYCAADLDFGKKERAGPKALIESRVIRPDLIPMAIEKSLGIKIDANKAFLKYGSAVLLAVIDWCEDQEKFRRGEISFHAMQNAMEKTNNLLAGMI